MPGEVLLKDLPFLQKFPFRFKHLAATPLGSKVRAEAFLKEVEGRRLVFDVAAYDEFEKISEGENEQLMVSINKFIDRVKRKRGRNVR